MGWFSFGKETGDAIASPITAVGNVLDSLFTSDEEREQAKAVMAKLEAQHKSTFVAGWRPALGWVCALGLAFVFVINPVIQWSSCLFGAACIAGPEMPLEAMMTLVVSLLGLGGLRTVEKIKGVTK